MGEEKYEVENSIITPRMVSPAGHSLQIHPRGRAKRELIVLPHGTACAGQRDLLYDEDIKEPGPASKAISRCPPLWIDGTAVY